MILEGLPRSQKMVLNNCPMPNNSRWIAMRMIPLTLQKEKNSGQSALNMAKLSNSVQMGEALHFVVDPQT